MTQLIHLNIRCRNKNRKVMLKEKMLILMINKVESEQCSVVKSANRVTVFQLNLKLEKE